MSKSKNLKLFWEFERRVGYCDPALLNLWDKP
jgi:hypothetical protein